MLGKVKTVLRRLNGAADGVADAGPRDHTAGSQTGETAVGTAADGADTASPPHLYECPACDQVYIATDKRTCSPCGVGVDRVQRQ